MGSTWVGIGAVSAFMAVALGAFGAHGLAQKLEPRSLQIFEIAVRYQMYHALGMIVLGIFASRSGANPPTTAGWSFLVGTFLFSGSLYALSLSGIRAFGAITPVGGAAFLLGWATFAWQAFRS